MLHWTNRNGCGGVCGVAKYCYCLWGCPDLFCNPSFIIHSANIRWGPALLVKASWELREFAVAEEPWEHSWWTRGASPPKQKDQVDPGDRLRPVGLLNKSVLFWKPKVPFFIFRDTLLSHPLFQTVLSLLLRGWNPIWSHCSLEFGHLHLCVVDVGISMGGWGEKWSSL